MWQIQSVCHNIPLPGPIDASSASALFTMSCQLYVRIQKENKKAQNGSNDEHPAAKRQKKGDKQADGADADAIAKKAPSVAEEAGNG